MGSEDQAHAVAMEDFTFFPVLSTVWMGLVAAAGMAYVLVLGLGPADSYDDPQAVHIVGFTVGIALVAVAAWVQVLVVRAWRRDLRSAHLVADDVPECACADTLTWFQADMSGLVLLGALAGAVGGTVYVATASDGAPWGWITPATAGLVLVSVSSFVSWRGREYVGVHPEGIRILSRGTLTVAPWSRVRSYGRGSVGIDGTEVEAS